MKRIILLIGGISLFVFDMVSQGNLQFSRVVFLEMEGTTQDSTNVIDQDTIIVPQGKVLKIESASMGRELVLNGWNYRLDRPNSNSQPGIYINEKILTYYNSPDLNGNFPLWLNEGVYIFKLTGLTSPSYPDIVKGYVSGIEFNITPP